MRTANPTVGLVVAFSILASTASATSLTGVTRVTLTDLATGKDIVSTVLQDGEPVVLNWRHSLFGLYVTEIFSARAGRLWLGEVTFADLPGSIAPAARPEDLDDLYQTGGPFSVKGLSKPFTAVTFRIGEIGDPKIRIGDRVVELKKEVGFGGAVRLTVVGDRPLEHPSN